MKVLIVLLGFLSAALADPGTSARYAPAYFPHGKVVTYKYTVDVKAGVMNPAPQASQFFIDSILTAQHYKRDLTLQNAYSIQLHNVTHKLYNGYAVHSDQPPAVPLLLPEAAKVIQTPFIIVFDERGLLQGIKWEDNESKWSKNIKKGIASMLQLDMPEIFLHKSMASRSFITRENTIHGSCQVAYSVQLKDPVPPVLSHDVVITKFHEPKNCSHFSYQTFNHVESEKCHVSEEDGMTTTSRRVVELTYRGTDILINKLIGHSVINYFPWQANAEGHYLLTNQTLILRNISPVAENLPLTIGDVDHDITFTKPDKKHAVNGDLDVTQGRHHVNQNELIVKVKKILDEAAGYLKEDHMEMKTPEWKHGQALNRILHILGFMNDESLKKVFLDLQNSKDTNKNIFLGMVPNVGTTAACLFTRNVISQKAVSDFTAITMLSKLPMHVKIPSEELLLEMEKLLNLDDFVSTDVKKASILCFATLIHRTFANGTTSPLLTKYLEKFERHLKSEPSYEMKMVYLMAIKNVAVTDILPILEPIIRGEMIISEDPLTNRIQAIWAIKKVVTELRQYAYDLLWPILQNTTLPHTLRIVAYDVLMNTGPDTGRFMHMYWFMVYEKNEHLYNYHVETIKGLIESADPCLAPLQEIARKILQFTRMRHAPGPLSTKFYIDSFDQVFGHGEALKVSLIMNQQTGLPYVGSFTHFTSVARKTVSRLGVHWHVNNLADILRDVKKEMFSSVERQVIDENVKHVLTKAARDMPPIKPTQICIFLTWNDNVVRVLHYNKTTWMKLFTDLKSWKDSITHYNLQDIIYDDHFEMHVPTDFGVPAILATRTPNLGSLKGRNITIDDGSLTYQQFENKHQQWKHGEYVMSIYNPIADAWHSIRRTGTCDVVVGTDVTARYDNDKKSVVMKFARLPVTEYSTTGLLTHAKNYVTVTDDNSGALTESCATCLHIHNVTGVISNKTHERSVDSKDIALRFFTAIYNCEGRVNPLPIADWHKAMAMPHDRPMDYKDWVRLAMRLRQKIQNDMISSQGASCSNLMKFEPSTVYAASKVELMVKVKIESLVSNPLHILSQMRFGVHGTMDVKSASTGESMRLWDANVNVNLSPGHVNNDMQITLTRATPEEENLQICIEGQANYPLIDTDLLNFKDTEKKTNKKLTITMGTTNTTGARDEMEVIINVNGETLEEQMSHAHDGDVHKACIYHKELPHLQTESGHVPKTWPCVSEAILHTTLRKYTTNVQLKLPPYVERAYHVFQDVVMSYLFTHISYMLNQTDHGKLKTLVQYPVGTHNADVTILQPFRSYQLLQLPFGHKMWNDLMDNVHFSSSMLRDVIADKRKFCTIHPRIVVTYDSTMTPFEVPETWTLLTGDTSQQTFSIFVKSTHGNRLTTRIVFGEHTMDIVPRNTIPATVNVFVNGAIIENHEKGILVPAKDINSYDMRLTANYAHLNIDSTWIPVSIHYTVNSVSVVGSTVLRGEVKGLCGSMNANRMEGDAAQSLNVYTLAEH